MPSVNALVLEEVALVALEVEQALESAGITIAAIARDLSDAARKIYAHQIDLAIVALGADEAASTAFCAALHGRGIAVVVLSTETDHAAGIPGLRVAPVVVKPFIRQQLLDAVDTALRQRPAIG